MAWAPDSTGVERMPGEPAPPSANQHCVEGMQNSPDMAQEIYDKTTQGDLMCDRKGWTSGRKLTLVWVDRAGTGIC